MKTKNVLLFVVMAVILSQTAYADWKANLRKGLLGTASIKVVDVDGLPIEGVNVSMHFGIMNGKGNTFKGVTDENGMVQFTGKSNDKCQVVASKQGYFSSWSELIFFPPHDENFISELERLAKTGKWESAPKYCTLVLQKEYTPAKVREQCLEFHCDHICQTNVPIDFIAGNMPEELPGEIVLSIKQVPASDDNAVGESSYVIFIESCDSQPCFLSRNRRKDSDYRFDTIAPEFGYTNSVQLYSIDADTGRTASIFNVNDFYIVYRKQIADGKFSYAVVSFIDMTVRKSGQFKLSFSYVCIPEETGNIIHFKTIGRGRPRTITISNAEAENLK